MHLTALHSGLRHALEAGCVHVLMLRVWPLEAIYSMGAELQQEGICRQSNPDARARAPEQCLGRSRGSSAVTKPPGATSAVPPLHA